MNVQVSWLRAYHTRRHESAADLVRKLSRSVHVQANDDGERAFFDIQALRSESFATATGPRASLQLDDDVHLPVETHLTFHVSGFAVMRATAVLAVPPDDPSLPDLLARLERLPWESERRRWDFASPDLGGVTGTVRELLNLLFLAMHEVQFGRPVQPALLAEQAQDTPLGNRRLQELCQVGELSYPLPVSFGTAVDVVTDDLTLPTCEALVAGVLLRSVGDRRGAEGGLVAGTEAEPWFLLENQSFSFTAPAADEPTTLRATRLALMEFLTLRRGALRSVQRDTQRILSGGHEVSRRRVDEWRLLVTTATDDYVLHVRAGQLLVPVVDHLAASPRVRDLGDLERQVRGNIDSFQARIDMASQSVSTIIGSLFAVVAAVIGLGSVVKVVVAEHRSIRVSELADVAPWVNSLIDLGMTVVAFLATWYLIRAASNRVPGLRPAMRRRRPAWVVRESEFDWAR